MYFDEINVIDIDEIINDKYKIYAHTDYKENELLISHIELCLKYFVKIVNEKKIDIVFDKIENMLCDSSILHNEVYMFKEMLVNTVALHDIGKVNALFQKNKMNNNLDIKGIAQFKYSDHSLLSSIIYINIYYDKIINSFDGATREKFLNIMVLNAYSISRHHGDLKSIDDFIEQFNCDSDFSKGYMLLNNGKILYSSILKEEITITDDAINEVFECVSNLKENTNKEFDICCYIYERLILSLLYMSDYYATSEFMSKFEIGDFGALNEIDEFYNVYKQGEIYGCIRKYEKEFYMKGNSFSDTNDINVLRNELFLDAESVLLKNINSDIFYLEAPTGSGKSNAAFNLSFKLLKKDLTKNKIFYIYPFNTLVEQNIKNLNKIFENKEEILNKIAVINSVEPVKMDKAFTDEENISLEYYKKALLNRQFLNYPIVLTTHVSFFNYLFGTLKENIFPFHQLLNSIIVLDEIQSYKNIIWGEIITFLTTYAKILNLKIIIMSATLPNLDLISLSEGNTVNLIENREKYFSNPIFKDRVHVDYSLLNSINVIDDLYNHIKNKSLDKRKILVEFISKNTAYKFLKMLAADDEILSEKELMTGDDNIAERERILSKIANSEIENGIILIATQVVEAGVDIDMDYGYKDISLFDSEEQFLGRINRSCKNRGEAYFFNLDDSSKVYTNDIRSNKDVTLKEENIREILRNKNFYDFYNIVIERLKIYTNKSNKYNIEDFFNVKVKKLEFENIQKHMKLIDDDNKISIYLSSVLEFYDKKLDGDIIWEEYKTLLEDMDMDYSKKRVKLSQIRSKMNNFIYEIKWKLDFTYNDRIGELYYIQDGEKYFTNGKLDKEKFKNGIGDFI